MEQHNPHQGGEHPHEHEPPIPVDQAVEAADHQTPAAEADAVGEQAVSQLHREALDLTYQAITDALRDGHPIDHDTARVIVAVLYDTPDSALGILATTGVITEGLAGELETFRTTAPTELEPWLDALDEYVRTNTSEHQVDNAEEEAAADLPAIPPDHEHPASAEQTNRITDQTARDIARQFRRAVDGPLDVFVRFGAVLNEDDELYQELFDGWEQHTPEQQEQVEALRSYIAGRQNYGPVSHWAEDRAPTPSGIQPEIWVGSLTDYNNGVLHGVWIDADQEVDELRERVGWLLLTSPTARAHREVAEEYGIFDYSGFGGYQVSEWSSLETVALIAQGIAEHGLAYAAWVEYVGDTAGALIDDDAFRDHYEGEWDSLTDYVEHMLDETGFHQLLDDALQALPEDLRRHVKVDTEGIAEEWEQGLHVVEAPGGRVWVFDARS
jgi:antirestriction protein